MALSDRILNLAERAQRGDVSLVEDLTSVSHLISQGLYADFIFETAIDHNQLELAQRVRQHSRTDLSVRAACSMLERPLFYPFLDEICRQEGGATLTNVVRLQCTMPNLGFGEHCVGLVMEQCWSLGEAMAVFDEIAKAQVQRDEAWKRQALVGLIPVIGVAVEQLREWHPLLGDVFDAVEAGQQNARIAQQVAVGAKAERRKRI